jgi:hypothetical protein
LRPSNPAKAGDTVDSKDQPLPTINDGTYKGFTHTIGFSVELAFDALFGSKRQIHYGDPSYEDVRVAPEPQEKKEEEKKEEEKKDEEKKDEEKKDTKKKADDPEKTDKADKKKPAEEPEKKPSKKPEAKKPDTKPEGPEPMIEDKREEKKPGKKNADGTCKWGEC